MTDSESEELTADIEERANEVYGDIEELIILRRKEATEDGTDDIEDVAIAIVLTAMTLKINEFLKADEEKHSFITAMAEAFSVKPREEDDDEDSSEEETEENDLTPDFTQGNDGEGGTDGSGSIV